MSDGTANLYFLDPETLAVVAQIQVRDGTTPATRLNELEYVNGEVWANVWQTDLVARISPVTGSVLGWIDLSGLLSPTERLRSVDVLNGIAYDAGSGMLLVTGKLWPTIFQIELTP
jgi:glutamine cyclotransferase